ncbi:MAG: leucine-rich repeat protein [Oscillospiraceae bacterium]|nr:leucine-rich repeat protein [Oscillospiraceae bacterium]
MHFTRGEEPRAWLKNHDADLALCLAFHSAPAHAEGYTRNATLKDGGAYPGVYYVKAVPGDSNATIGIPSLDKNTLNVPTTESPAIIMGAAVPYEVKTGPTEFTQISGGALYPPYSYFCYNIIDEQGPDGTWHKKMSGFDGSYFLIRVDVSELIKDAPAGSYLHVKQEGNKALMASLLYEKYDAAAGRGSFSDALGNKTVVYAIDNGGVSMKDKDGSDRTVPYVDVIVYSSGTLVAGADTGSTAPDAQSADFALKFYIDKTPDYNPSLDYDPNNQSTTTPTHAEQVMAKFYDESKAKDAQVTSYTIKGNDLEIEIMNNEHSPRQFWSLRKAMGHYNNSPIKMICEVPVLEGLLIDGGRNVIFDVNSFDIQIANHQQSGAAALTVRNGTLKVMDSFNTTGAELAVGNNARMSIEAGGTLIIDETCQVEVEYDAASVTPGTDPVTYDFGVISIGNGGHIINNGVISIEGTEGKPIDPAAPTIRDMKAAELHIEEGGKLTNNGCVLVYGGLYNLGTIENNGRYNDTIESNDPDKGQFTYHKGIQIAWKDDVTQSGVLMGQFNNGDYQKTTAAVTNNGDIVLMPGFLENYGTLENTASGNVYLCAVDEAVIPTSVTWSVLIMEQRIGFELPAGTKEIGEAAFEGVPVKSVEIPASCTFIAAEAFKDCSALRQVLVLSADTTFSPTAFAGCKDVYIFAPEESLAKEFCTEGSGFIFVCLTK